MCKFSLLKANLVFFILFIVIHSDVLSQPFEGKIFFTRESLLDTFYYNLYVKDNMIRFEELNKKKAIIKYYLLDLETNTIKAINPYSKMYMDIPKKPSQVTNDAFEIIKSENSKEINGYICYQWRVKNKTRNTEISYWVVEDQFNFFDDFLKLLRLEEKTAEFFLKIPDTNGVLPMLFVERTLLRVERMKMAVTEINRTKLQSSIFKIPSDYIQFDR